MEEVKYPDGCIKCLNHGFVKLVDVMGDDSSIVQAARVSYGKGTKQVNEDRGLIRYLLRHQHTTPFEMVEFKFHCRMPIFVARQWVRHRTANINEMSGRYSEMPDLFYVPEKEKITKQSTINKQGGSDEVMDDCNRYQAMMIAEQEEAYKNYKFYIDSGMRKELARNNMPLSLYSEWYWKCDLHNLFHFLKLRLDSHAQHEIQVYGQAMAELMKPYVPLAWEAFEDYLQHSIRFSKPEIEQMKKILALGNVSAYLTGNDLTSVFGNKREGEEFQDKLKKLMN